VNGTRVSRYSFGGATHKKQSGHSIFGAVGAVVVVAWKPSLYLDEKYRSATAIKANKIV
jgi:hypothetical protein